VDIDWKSLSAIPTHVIIRERRLSAEQGAGILWSSDSTEFHELSAFGALAWEGREGTPAGNAYEWTGSNLLCNAAPTPFALDGERFSSIDSFYNALRFPEGSSERTRCALAPALETRRLVGRYRDVFVYQGKRIAVRSAEHEGLVAAAISAKVEQNPDVQVALSQTRTAKLIFPLTFSLAPGVLARVTPLTLMIERWKRFHGRL
jgi:hypothetical protein